MQKITLCQSHLNKKLGDKTVPISCINATEHRVFKTNANSIDLFPPNSFLFVFWGKVPSYTFVGKNIKSHGDRFSRFSLGSWSLDHPSTWTAILHRVFVFELINTRKKVFCYTQTFFTFFKPVLITSLTNFCTKNSPVNRKEKISC